MKKYRDSAVKRLFFAIDLPDSTVASAQNVIAGFNISGSRVRWARAGLHITLKFLGAVETGVIPSICKAAGKTAKAFRPMRLVIKGMGLFPNRRMPRIIWFGVSGQTDELAGLEGELAKALEPLDFPADQRPFTAHITAGRMTNDSARGEVIRLVHQNQGVYIGEAPVESICLYESRLSPGSSIYNKLESFPLVDSK